MPQDQAASAASSAFSVAKIEIGRPDAAGRTVKSVHAKSVPLFAVYMTDAGVVVNYADDAEEEARQRRRILQLNPLRGEVSALIGDWRRRRPDKASRYQSGIADALTGALQGDIPGSLAILQDVRTRILQERESWGRQLYILFAGYAAAALIAALILIGSDWYGRHVYRFPVDQLQLFLCLGAGAFGALFSIAQTVNRKTTLPDLRLGSNAVDAILRIGIGVLASGFLFCVLKSEIIKLEIGSQSLNALGTNSWYAVVVIGFLAGFSEQLIPNLLGKIEAGISEAQPGAEAPPDTPKTPAERAAAAAVAREAAAEASPPPGGDDEDGCLCDHDHAAAAATPDSHLPASVGGVAVDEDEDDACPDHIHADEATPDAELPASVGGVAPN